jgi:hypothetical protein
MTPPPPTDPIIAASNLLVAFLTEEDIEPMVSMTAMIQLAAKICADSCDQDNLSPEDAKERWMGGCKLAWEGVNDAFPGQPPPSRRRLKVVDGGKKNGSGN